MISPASGIHRPSYNAAPAILTLYNYDMCRVSPLICEYLAPQRVRRDCRIARPRIYENELRQNRCDDLHPVFFMRMMSIMRWMRNLADIQLRQQHKHESLNERHEQT